MGGHNGGSHCVAVLISPAEAAVTNRGPRYVRSVACAVIVAALLMAHVAWAARDHLLARLAEFWIVSDTLEPADVVVIFGGGLETRPFVAADYYKAGLVKGVLLSNVRPSRAEVLGVMPQHAELNKRVLLALGVPESAIQTFGSQLSNTYEEATALHDWVLHTHTRAVIIPSDVFSSRRVRWMVNHALADASTRTYVVALDSPEYGRHDWWCREQGLVAFQNEVVKYVYYRLKY